MSQVVLHIGDTIGILSAQGYVTGRIIYYSPTLLRILPHEYSDRAVEFPMENGGATFAPDLGVSLVELIEKQPSNYYVDVLGARPGETLEFFTVDGQEAAPRGIVEEVLKSTTKDSIKLTDGRVYKFRGIGPPDPIAVIRVLSGETDMAEGAEGEVEPEEPSIAQTEILSLLRQVLPAATMEVVPTAERSYPDSMQREDLFQDLMADLTEKQQSNPRRIRMIEREVDLALSLKNKSLTGNHTVQTVKEAVATASAAIPIVQAARVLYLDDADSNLSYKESDVVPRSLEATEVELEQLAVQYLDGALPDTMGKGFAAYMYELVGRGQATLQGSAPTMWKEDQDILRTADPATAVQGLSANLPIEAPVSLAFLLSDVKDRMVRVLDKDPSVVTGYVILPPKAALALRPPKQPGHLPTALLYSATLESDNLPTVAQAIYDLYSPEASPQHAWTLRPEADTDVAEWLSSVLQFAVHPVDSLGPRGPRLLSLLDTLGLGATDLSPATAEILWNWVNNSQATWRNLLMDRRTTIQAALDAEALHTFGPVSALWTNLRAAESLKEIYEDIERKYPAIAGAPSVVAASLLQEAQGDAAPLVWYEIMKMDARLDESIDLQAAKDALATSRRYLEKRAEYRNAHLLTMVASPEVNPCPHVDRLEAIRNVTDVVQRSRLLRTFIEEHQGPRHGEWITCSLCTQDCVCYHELMELEALAQPSRMDSIQKQILVKYGGDRYEGNIICRNCGQGLQELDYDDHVEFDDSGRPIVTASVLTDDQKEDSPLAPPIQFATQSQRDLHDALQIMMDRGGLQVSPDVIRQIIRYADIYVNVRSPKQEEYEKMRTTMMLSAAKKTKKATGITGGEDVATFRTIQDRLRVSALTALMAIAIQSSDPPVIVNNPAPLCKFSREGYPFNPSAKPEEEGALLYMACVVASIERVTSPWNAVQWAGLANPSTRTTAALKSALVAVQAVLGVPEGQPLPFTPEVRLALTQAQTDLVAKRKKEQVSLADQLPVGFRPEPFPPKMSRPSVERDPVKAIQDTKSVDSVADSMRQQSIAIVGELHEAAFAAVTAAGQGQGIDAVCCAVPLAGIRELMGAPEQARLVQARNILRGMIPTAVNAGTHLWPTFEPSISDPVISTVDEGIYFKLFLKYCYTGPQVGEVHEFSAGNVCRQCGLSLGEVMDQIDFTKDGARILAMQQGRLRVEATTDAFYALSEAVRRRRMILGRVEIGQEPWITGLQTLVKAASPRLADALNESLAELKQDMEDMDRIQAWTPVAVYMDELRHEIGDRIGPLVPKMKGQIARAEEAKMAFDMLDTLTEDPFVEGPRALQEYLCAKVQSAGLGYTVKQVAGAVWNELSTNHREMMNKLVTDNSMWYSGELSDGAKAILKQMSASIGPMVRIWIQVVRPATVGTAWTIQEAQMVLRTFVLEAWRDAVVNGSPWYATIASPAEREAISADVANWTRALMFHVKKQYIRYSKETIKRILQDRSALERDTIVEEFESIKDDDLRAAELLKKQFRIGRWAGGANLQKYDADVFEFESEQRKRMGIMDPSTQPIAGGPVPPVQDYGLALAGGPEDGYDVAQGAEGDDY